MNINNYKFLFIVLLLERGRDLNGVLLQYQRFVKPSFDSYIAPQVKQFRVLF